MKDTYVSETIPQALSKRQGNSVVTPQIVTDSIPKREIDWGQALRKFVSGCLVLTMGIILAYHLYLFWTVGSVIIEEPNRVLLFIETMISLAIIVFGLELILRK